jgi:hypothetical protein
MALFLVFGLYFVYVIYLFIITWRISYTLYFVKRTLLFGSYISYRQEGIEQLLGLHPAVKVASPAEMAIQKALAGRLSEFTSSAPVSVSFLFYFIPFNTAMWLHSRI